MDGQVVSLSSRGKDVIVGSKTEALSPTVGIGGAIEAGLGGVPGGQSPGTGSTEALKGGAWELKDGFMWVACGRAVAGVFIILEVYYWNGRTQSAG